MRERSACLTNDWWAQLMSVLPRLSNKGEISQMPAVLAPLVVRSRFSVLARNLCEEVLFFLLLLLPS